MLEFILIAFIATTMSLGASSFFVPAIAARGRR